MNYSRYLATGLAVLLPTGCEVHKEAQDPREHIIGDKAYVHREIGFGFSYSTVLQLKQRETPDHVQLALRYPGMAPAFELDVKGAVAEYEFMEGAVPGSQSSAMVDGVGAIKFRLSPAFDERERYRIVAKRDGWVYAFTGKGQAFDDIVDAFRFQKDPPPPLDPNLDIPPQ